MEEQEKRVKIYSYTKVWRIEKKIYAVNRLVLPMPVNPFDVLYFLATMLVILLIGKILPPFNMIPWVLRFGAFPYLVTGVLMKKKLDGKNPIKYFAGVLRHYFTKDNYCQGFKHYAANPARVTLHWSCSRGKPL